MKRIVKYSLLVISCLFFMLLFNSNNVEANYDRSKNYAQVSITKNQIRIRVTYQRGFDREKAIYKWCHIKDESDYTENFREQNCSKVAGADEVNYVDFGGAYDTSYIAKGDALYVDGNPTHQDFIITPDDDSVLAAIKDNDPSHKEKTYVLLVITMYCAVREEVGGEFVGCRVYDDDPSNKYASMVVSTNMLYDNMYTDSISKDVVDENIESLLTEIEEIVNTIVMPIIWVVLGMFFLVKGTLLGVQIVKSADEPQVRQEKIGSLKWLVIGVAISYATSFVVSAVIGFFEEKFG